MYLTGFADEAVGSIEDQVRVVTGLGWSHVDLRNVGGTNVHDLDEAALDHVAQVLSDAGVGVPCIGSAIANGQANIEEDPPDKAIEQTVRCIAACQRLGVTRVRIMSWPPRGDHAIDGPTSQARFARLREIHARFADAGIAALHENCHNYGGQSAAHTLRLIEAVPGLRLIFDTANPIPTQDQSYPGEPKPRQSVFELWAQVRDHVDYIHIKDGVFDPTKEERKFVHGWPGEGMGDVRAVLKDAIARGYDDAISIEPHVGGVHLLPGSEQMPDAERKERNFVEYGKRMARVLADIGAPIAGAVV